jgi:hypothetical protein
MSDVWQMRALSSQVAARPCPPVDAGVLCAEVARLLRERAALIAAREAPFRTRPDWRDMLRVLGEAVSGNLRGVATDGAEAAR